MIPNKSNFKFQELTPITGVKPYVIRFWETEFPEIDPITSDSGQKLYARRDVEAILKIKELLFDQKMSIPEAKVAMQGAGFEAYATQAHESHKESGFDVKGVLASALELIKEIKLARKW